MASGSFVLPFVVRNGVEDKGEKMMNTDEYRQGYSNGHTDGYELARRELKDHANSAQLTFSKIADDIERAVCVIQNGSSLSERGKGWDILAGVVRQLRKT